MEKKNKSLSIFNLVFLLCLFLYFFLCLYIPLNRALAAREAYTTIKVFNPYKISVDMLVKCDWVHTRQAYKFHKVFRIKSKSNITIETPKSLNNCEIWAGNVSLF